MRLSSIGPAFLALQLGCNKPQVQKTSEELLYTDNLTEETCYPQAPCGIWGNTPPWFGDCILSKQLKDLDHELSAKIRKCLAATLPMTTPENDMCLRDRSIEGWLRQNMTDNLRLAGEEALQQCSLKY